MPNCFFQKVLQFFWFLRIIAKDSSVTFIISYRIKEINFKLLNKSIQKETFSIAIPAMLINTLMYLNYHADVLFRNQMTRKSVLIRFYGTAITVGNMLWVIPDAFKDVLYNRAAKKENPKEVSIAIFCNFSYPSMTRFIMSLEETVDLVLFAFEHGQSGDIVLQKASACTIQTQAEAVCELFGKNKIRLNS